MLAILPRILLCRHQSLLLAIKAELVKKGTSELTKILNNSTKKDSTATPSKTNEDITKKANELLNGIFKKKKKEE